MKFALKQVALVALIGLTTVACKQEPETPTEEVPATNDGQVIQDAQVVSGSDLPVVMGPSGQISPQTRSVLEALSKNYWYVEAWMEMNQGQPNREAAVENRGRWFQFNMDGTMSSGKLDKTIDSGTWIYDPQKAYLSMDMQNTDDMEIDLKMTHDGSVMVWVGTERFNQNNVQLKLENYLEQMAEMPAQGN